MSQEDQLRVYILNLPKEDDGRLMHLVTEDGSTLLFTMYELKAIFNAKQLIEVFKNG